MKLKILLILLLLIANARADKYLRADAPGGGNGANWSTAYNTMALLEANLARGEIGWVADGTYTIGYQIFDVPPSGTTLCTIKKATTSAHGTETGWNSAYGDGQAYFIGNWFVRTDYWLFDGVTGGGPGNWTSGFGFRIDSTVGHENIRMDSGAQFCTFRHVELHGAGEGDDANPGSNDCFSTWDGSSDATLSYAYIIDAGRCPIAIADDNVVIEYVWTGKFESTSADHAETITARQGGDQSGNPGVFNIIVRYNYFTYFRGTGGILFKGNGMYVYGNIFHRFPTNTSTAPYGFHGKWDQKPQHNFYAWNNTYIDPQPVSSDPKGSPFFNHYLEQAGTEGTSTSNKNIYNGILFKDSVWDPNNFTATNHDYNHFAQIVGVTPNANAGEANGSNSAVDPFVNYQAGNYGLTAAQAAAIPPARNLTGVAPYNTLPGYNVDMFGNTRGADNKWDKGAIEFVATGGGDVTAPTIFSATIDAEGDDLVVTFNEDVDWKTGSGMTMSSPSGGAVTLSNPQNTGGAEITWDLSRVINSSETAITISYATVANGIEDLALNDLAATTTPFPVTNNTQQGTVQPPLISLVSGFYYGTQNVTLTPQTSGSTIRYTTDNTDPTSSSNLYSTPIPVSVPTTLKARGFKSGSIDSTVAAESYSVGTWIFPQTSGDWVDFAVPQQTGVFTWRFRAMVPSLGADSVIGLGPTTGFDHWDDTAVALRFRTTNVIDCINGAGGDGTGTVYQAVNVFPYVANATYEFVVTVKVPDRTYSATVQQVAPTTGAVTVIATDYEFRNGHENTADLDNLGALGLTSETTVSNMSFGVDATAPTPNPMTFASNPTAVDNFSITMMASPAVDDLNNPVQYFFEETSGNAGATDSGWQPEPVYTDVGLTPGTQYSYYVWARDNVLNQGSPSATLSATTPLVIPSGSAANCETLNVTTLRVGP